MNISKKFYARFKKFLYKGSIIKKLWKNISKF